MKIKNKFRTILLSTGLALISSSVAVGYFADVAPALAEEINMAELFGLEPIHEETDWYTLDANPETNKLSLFFSPQPGDYRTINKGSINSLMNGLINGAKDIATGQVKFILPVDIPELKEEDWELYFTEDARPKVIDAMINQVLRDEENDNQVINEYVKQFVATVVSDDFGIDGNPGSFLLDMLSYIVAYGEGGSTDDAENIPTRLGVVVKPGGIVEENGALTNTYKTLYQIYKDYGYPTNVDKAQDQAAIKAQEAIQKIYDNAVSINSNNTLKAQSIIKIFGGLEKTTVPMKTVIVILGAQNVLNCIKSIFTDQNLGINYAKHFLNDLSNRTFTDICDTIQSLLYDPTTGTGGFNKDEIFEAFQLATNTRLMEIFDGLSPNGLNNIRIVLGKPVDYDEGGFFPVDRDPNLFTRSVRRLTSSHQASASDYAKYGSELMETIMGRLVVNDLFTTVKDLTIIYNEVEYTLLYQDTNAEDNTESNLILGVHDIVDLLNALPKMSEIREKDDEFHRISFDVKLLTPINDRVITYTDETKTEVASDVMTPIYYHCEVGFQNKDCEYIRKLAGILDDTFDLEFDFEDDGEFWVDLTTRNPRFISNIYAWLCDSGFIKNEATRKFLVEIWDLAFSDLGTIRDYIKDMTVQDIVDDLKNIDYEVALRTLTTAQELNQLFGTSKFTDARIEKAVNTFVKLIKKGTNTSYEDIVQLVEDALGEGISSKLNNETLKAIYEKVQNLLKRLEGKEISVEMLKGITNDSIYGYVAGLTGKSDLILKVKERILSAFNYIPDEYLSRSIMDAYVGNGEFKGNGSIEIPWDKIAKGVKALPGGDAVWVGFDGMVPEDTERPSTFTFYFDSFFKDIYSIEYQWNYDEETETYMNSKKGMLHKYIEDNMGGMLLDDSDVIKFAGIEEDNNGAIVHWLDKDALAEGEFVRVDNMPSEDIVVVPEYLYEVTISEDIDEVYDANESYDISVTLETNFLSYYDTITYQWQKSEDEGDTWEDVAGETSDTISVKTVNDSGLYRCVVNNDDQEVISASASVVIEKAEVDLTPVALKKRIFVYTGSDITVEIDPATIPDTATFKEFVEGQTEKDICDDGEKYTVKAEFELVDPDNYKFKDDNPYVEREWEIHTNVVDFTPVWLGVDDFASGIIKDGGEHIADGTVYANAIDPSSYDSTLFDVVYSTKFVDDEEDTTLEENGRETIGKYVTIAEFVPLGDYVAGETSDSGEATFTIYTIVDVGCLEWSYHDEFTYDGNSHRVFVENLDHLSNEDAEFLTGVSYVTTTASDSEEHDTTDNKFINADSYSSVAVPEFKESYYDTDIVRFADGSNNVFGEDNAKDWIINPKTIYLTDDVWSDGLTYNGEEQTTSLINGTNFEFVDQETISYLNEDGEATNAATNAGNYTAVVTISSNDPNYVFGETTISHDFVIAQREIEVTEVTWSDVLSYIYDGENHEIEVTAAKYNDDGEGADFNMEGDEILQFEYLSVTKGGTNAGAYDVSVMFTLIDDENYVLVGQNVFENTLIISPRTIEITSYSWSPVTVVYDGEDHAGDPEISIVYTDVDQTGIVFLEETDEILSVEYIRPEEAVNADDYELSAKFVLLDNVNYVFVGDYEFDSALTITPKEIDLENSNYIVWSEEDTFTYDGTVHSVEASIVGDDADVIIFGYEHNSSYAHEATYVGEYTAKIVCSVIDEYANNYVIKGEDTFTFDWEITKKEIVVTIESWTTSELTYNREEQYVYANYTVEDSSDEEQVVVSYVNDSGEITNAATIVGDYEAVVNFSLLDSDNYSLSVIDNSIASNEWSIVVKTITVSEVTWSNELEFVYDGEEHSIAPNFTITEATDADMLNISLTGDKGTNASGYEAVLSITLLDTHNFELVFDDETSLSQEWSISKAVIVVADLTWNYEAPYTYSGDEYKVYILNELPEQVQLDYEGTLVANNADNYNAEASIYIKDEYASNYELENGPVISSNLDWVINKKHISIGDVIWSNDSFVYSGEEQEVEVVNYDNMNLISIESISGNKATVVGDYYAVANFKLNDEDNYILDIGSAAHYYVITKCVISVHDISWTNGNLTYNGSEQSIELSYADEDLINAEITGNSATNAGNYLAKVDFILVDEDNYELIGVNHIEQNWVINKAVIYVSDAIWTDEQTPFIYNGSEQVTKIVDISDAEKIGLEQTDLDKEYAPSYFGNVAINAGNYVATVIIHLLPEYEQNYVLNTDVIVHEYSITKAVISVENIVWNYNPSNPFSTDGSNKEVGIVSYDNEELLSFEYVNEEGFTNVASEVGNYVAKAEFTLKADYVINYEFIGDSEFCLNWKIVQGEITLYYTFTSYGDCDNDQNPYGIIQVITGIEENPTLSAKLSEGNEFDGLDIDFESLIGGKGEVKYSYNISFENNGENYTFQNNNFIIKVMVPEDIRSGEYVVVVRNADDTVTKVNAEFTEDGKYAVIRGDSVKNVGFVTAIPHSQKLGDNLQNLAIILIAGAGQIVFVVCTVVCARKIRKDREKND